MTRTLTSFLLAPRTPLAAALLALLLVGLTGCDLFEDVFGGDQEISGTVEEIGDDFVVVDGTTYTVTADTEYEGYTGLDDIAVGDPVDIEYEDRSGERVALEIEDPRNEDED
jgi:hypothetical protein